MPERTPREQLAALLVEHTPIVRPLLIECRGCAVSFGTDDAFATHVAERIVDLLSNPLKTKLARNRTTSKRYLDGEYKNRAHKGYDVALTEALGLLGVDATERKAGRA